MCAASVLTYRDHHHLYKSKKKKLFGAYVLLATSIIQYPENMSLPYVYFIGFAHWRYLTF